ncbi:PAN domain-containing protein [Tianweitania aestuarii]|nr:PAN domain-containing protein [Tianweitania aestuarii]
MAVGPGLAEIKNFGPFKIDTARPDVIALEGPIDDRAALAFRRALLTLPDVKLMTLNSPGGEVDNGLLIADDVFQRKLATYIAPDAECYSACSYIFLAGDERRVEGKLGVHQISSQRPDLASAQFSISDIIDMLNRFGTPTDVLTIMFRTPPDDMYVFNEADITKYGINRSRGSADTPRAPAAPLADVQLPATATNNAPAVVLDTPTPSVSMADSASLAELSVIEDYAKRPNRLALYTGLDFSEQDIASEAVDDAKACALRCLETGGACRAFTFNITTPKSPGPNCFLKSARGQLDGNASAISGQLLSRADSYPSSFTIGVIDPKASVFENVDLVGGDLSRKPFTKAKTARDCRLACVDNDSCRAFTYLKRKKECWLKSGASQPRAAADMISGLKKIETFEPATVIDLE